MNAMMPVIRSRSRKVNGYVKAVLALEAVRRKREARYHRILRPLDRQRDALTVEVATRLRALSGGQRAAAQRLLAVITQAIARSAAADRDAARSRGDPKTSRASGDGPVRAEPRSRPARVSRRRALM
jgi:hypothetical protein